MVLIIGVRFLLDRFLRLNFKACVGCPCWLRSCIDVIVVDGVDVKVFDVCCRSCVKRFHKVLGYLGR